MSINGVYDPISNYSLVAINKWPDRTGNHKTVGGGLTANQCASVCDGDSSCEGFYSSSIDCQTYSGINITGLHDVSDTGASTYKKIKQQFLGSGKYIGAPVQVAGCGGGCNNDPSSGSFGISNGARRPVVPNTNGHGSCGGFNGYGGWAGWDLGFGPGMPGNGCPERFDISMCPANLGIPTGGSYVDANGGAGFDSSGKLYTSCTYNTLNWPALITNSTQFNEDLGTQLLTAKSWIQAKNDYCTSSDSVISSRPCQAWFANPAAGISYNQAKMAVCSDIKLVPDWGKNVGCVNAVNNVMNNPNSPQGDVSAAEAMINAYCITGSANQKLKICACVNVIQNKISGCTANPTLPGCDGIAKKISILNQKGAQIIIDELKPYCACDECQQAANGNDGTVIAQQQGPQGECNVGINACFSQNTIGSMSGGNFNASCNITTGAGTGGATGGKGATGGTSGGTGGTSGGGGTTGGTGGGGTTGGTSGGTGGTSGGGGTSKTTYEIICVVIVCLCLILFLIGIFFTMKNSKVSQGS